MMFDAPATLAELDADPAFLKIVFLAYRRDLLRFMETIAHSCAPPAHGIFRTYFTQWLKMPWGIAALPWADKARIESLGVVNGFRLADGVPTVVEADNLRSFIAARRAGKEQFPLASVSVFTLEPLHKIRGPHVGGVFVVPE